ncbi:MAG TPA: LysR family transcriptional regulator [Kofleriaceae bacterium]|nr:LysR family transcriptional regulator [Kofleriaceae bacterium]
MNYEHLRSFVVFAAHKNFTHAARELALSQPALHVQIRKLTEAVGRPLYVRSGRGLVLTRDGERLAAFGRDTLGRGGALLAELRGERGDAPVVLAAGRGAYLYLLAPALRRFQRAGGRLRLVVAGGDEAVAMVAEARADLAVAAVAPSPSTRGAPLVAEPVRVTRHVAVLPRDHALARRRRVRAADLDGEPLVIAPSASRHRAAIAAAFAAAGAELAVAVEAADWDLMMQLTALGAGVCIVNDMCRPPAGTVAVPFEGLAPVTYQLLRRRDAGGIAVDRLAATFLALRSAAGDLQGSP